MTREQRAQPKNERNWANLSPVQRFLLALFTLILCSGSFSLLLFLNYQSAPVVDHSADDSTIFEMQQGTTTEHNTPVPPTDDPSLPQIEQHPIQANISRIGMNDMITQEEPSNSSSPKQRSKPQWKSPDGEMLEWWDHWDVSFKVKNPGKKKRNQRNEDDAKTDADYANSQADPDSATRVSDRAWAFDDYVNPWLENELSQKITAKTRFVIISGNIVKPENKSSNKQEYSASKVFRKSHRCYANHQGYAYLAFDRSYNWFEVFPPKTAFHYQKVAMLLYLLNSAHPSTAAADDDDLLSSPKSNISDALPKGQNHHHRHHSKSTTDLSGVEWFVWFDGDTLVTNCAKSLERNVLNMTRQMYEKYDSDGIQVVLSGGSVNLVNNGVFMMKNTRWVRDFVENWLRLCLEFARFDPKGWFDQSALYLALKGVIHQESKFIRKLGWYERDKYKEWYKYVTQGMHVTSKDNRQALHQQSVQFDPSVQSKVVLVPPSVMNSVRRTWRKGDLVLHMAGPRNKDRGLGTYTRQIMNCPCFRK